MLYILPELQCLNVKNGSEKGKMSNISGNQFVYSDLPSHVSDFTLCLGFHSFFHVRRGYHELLDSTMALLRNTI